MSFGTSETYIYAYIGFASVYLIASLLFAANALRLSTGLSRARQPVASAGGSPAAAVTTVLGHGQRLVDYTQLATLLPLVYIVASMFLGSVISRDIALASVVNLGWVVFTVACALIAVVLAVLGIRESGAIGQKVGPAISQSGRATEALQRIGARLGVSAALLLLVAVFTMLNLWSILSSLDALHGVDFLL
jgi:hypothetical protein